MLLYEYSNYIKAQYKYEKSKKENENYLQKLKEELKK